MAVELITVRDLIIDVLESWNEHFDGSGLYDAEKREVALRLGELDLRTATAEQVNEIIGNDSWTAIYCSACGNKVNAAIAIDNECDDPGFPSYLCLACVKEAAALCESDEAKAPDAPRD